jgi:hypothetical protein
MSQHKIKQAKKAKEDKKLDEALKGSFPGSDPVALSQPGPAERKPVPAKPEPAGNGEQTDDEDRRR